MSGEKVRNRWLVVIGALLVQLCLGAIYAWGAFTNGLGGNEAQVVFSVNPRLIGVSDIEQYEEAKKEVAEESKKISALTAQLSETDNTEIEAQIAAHKTRIDELTTRAISLADQELLRKHTFNFSATQLMIIFSVGLAAFGGTMIQAGKIQDKIGPQKLAITGGIVLGIGYILAGLVGTSFIGILIFIGLIGGAGIGLGYVCPIAACVKWFPDLKGFVTGVAVAGFGAGAFFFIKLAGDWGNLLYNFGISSTFIIFGIIFAAAVAIGGALLSNPPAGWKPANWNPGAASGGAPKPVVKDLTQGEAIRTSEFWMIWAAFVFSAGCGLMIIGNLRDFGINAGLSAVEAGTALGLLALFNGLGRIAWGTISQKLTARYALVLMAVLQAGMMFILSGMGGSVLTLAIASCWLGFNFGGNFALFPLLTLEKFGGKNLGANYGAVFTAYGVGGILGPIMAGVFRDHAQSMFPQIVIRHLGIYGPSFVIAGIACVITAVIGFGLRTPKLEPAGEAITTAEALTKD